MLLLCSSSPVVVVPTRCQVIFYFVWNSIIHSNLRKNSDSSFPPPPPPPPQLCTFWGIYDDLHIFVDASYCGTVERVRLSYYMRAVELLFFMEAFSFFGLLFFFFLQEPSATPRLLRLIQRWMKEQARGGGGGAVGGGAGAGGSSGRQQGDVQDWAALGAEGKEFLGISLVFFVFFAWGGEGIIEGPTEPHTRCADG